MTLQSDPLPPVEHHVHVALAPADAFDLFTQQISRWWPFRRHSCFGDDAVDVVFEPRVGGAVSEVARNGARTPWGSITEWSPPDGFAMRWYPGSDATEATQLRVQFVAVDCGTEVSVHHSGWESRGARAAERRDKYDGGWPATLGLSAPSAPLQRETWRECLTVARHCCTARPCPTGRRPRWCEVDRNRERTREPAPPRRGRRRRLGQGRRRPRRRLGQRAGQP